MCGKVLLGIKSKSKRSVQIVKIKNEKYLTCSLIYLDIMTINIYGWVVVYYDDPDVLF